MLGLAKCRVAAAVDLPGTSGNYASTPDSAALSITGDIDIRIKVALDDWTPSATQGLVSKWHDTGDQHAYLFNVQIGGALKFFWSTNGANFPSAISTATPSFTDGTARWVRVTFDVDNGAAGNDVKFYTSTDGVTWTQLGATVTTAGIVTMFDSNALGILGSTNGGTSQNLAGNIYYAEIRNGIGGTVVAKFDPQAVQTRGTRNPTSYTSTTGEVWTVNGTGWAWVGNGG